MHIGWNCICPILALRSPVTMTLPISLSSTMSKHNGLNASLVSIPFLHKRVTHDGVWSNLQERGGNHKIQLSARWTSCVYHLWKNWSYPPSVLALCMRHLLDLFYLLVFYILCTTYPSMSGILHKSLSHVSPSIMTSASWMKVVMLTPMFQGNPLQFQIRPW